MNYIKKIFVSIIPISMILTISSCSQNIHMGNEATLTKPSEKIQVILPEANKKQTEITEGNSKDISEINLFEIKDTFFEDLIFDKENKLIYTTQTQIIRYENTPLIEGKLNKSINNIFYYGLSATGKYAANNSDNGKNINVFELINGEYINIQQLPANSNGSYNTIVWDNNDVLYFGSDNLCRWEKGKDLICFNDISGFYASNLNLVSISPLNNKLLFIEEEPAYSRFTLNIIDLPSRAKINVELDDAKNAHIQKKDFFSIIWSGDESKIGVIRGDGKVVIYKSNSLEIVNEFETNNTTFTAAWSPKNDLIFTLEFSPNSTNNIMQPPTINIYDANSLVLIHSIKTYPLNSSNESPNLFNKTMRISPDGKIIALSDGRSIYFYGIRMQ